MNKTKTLIASTDREMLDYLMQAFDSEMGVCERCGHEESTATCDSATFLRDYLSAYPAPTAGDAGTIERFDLDRAIEPTMEPSDRGDYVLYVDHLQHVAAAYAKGRGDAVRDYIDNGRAATAPVSAAPADDGWSMTPPTKPGVYRHRHEVYAGGEKTVFVGWVDPMQPRNQGTIRPMYAMHMRVCPVGENLHIDRLTPEAWGGFWQEVSAGAPVSAAEQAGAVQNEANSPQTRMDAQSEVLPAAPAAVQELPALPETTDAAREYLVAWHHEAFATAPYFSVYIKTTLAGDFAYHLARWLARAALALRQPQGDEAAMLRAAGAGFDETLEFAARVLELYDDATMRSEYMIDSCDAAAILRAMKGAPAVLVVAAKQAGKAGA